MGGSLVNKIVQGDAFETLKTLPDNQVDCVITSPPYWAVRDYRVDGQIGLEPTISEYISRLTTVFSEVKRVLKKEGSCWVVMGDTYGRGNRGPNTTETIRGRLLVPKSPVMTEKTLCLIPDRFAISMVDSGWILRNRIIWYKPNCMPSSAKDRFTIDFEHVFFFTKSPRYYFETQYEPLSRKYDEFFDNKAWSEGRAKYQNHRSSRWMKTGLWPAFGGKKGSDGVNHTYSCEQRAVNGHGRIKRAVWKIPTSSYSEAHFATFPERLIETPIKATCPINGVVLDPFMGAGTTGLVALKNARKFLGIELNPSYIEMANKRLEHFLKQSTLTF